MIKNYNITLPDSNMYGYGCINNTRIRVSEIDNKSKKTKAYKELVNIFREHFLHEDYIAIDILNGNHGERIKLNLIIDKLSKNVALSYKPKGYIIIPTLSELGTTIKEVKKNYLKILDHRIAVMIFDNEELSCCDYGFDEFTKTREDMEHLLNDITANVLVNRQGRDRTHVLDDNFKQLYWYYENYFITEELALTNNLTGHFTKKVFYRLCSEYEASDKYEEDELTEIQKSSGLLLDKPKRYGMTKEMKELFPDLVSLVSSGILIDDACTKLGIHPMTEHTYKRFLLRAETGKKGMVRASKEFLNDDIVEEIKGN